MKNKITCLLFCFAFIAIMMSLGSNAYEVSDYRDFSYVVEENGSLTITGYYDTGETMKTLVIPSWIKGKPVRKIGERAFYGSHHNIEEIVVPRTVETIDSRAFEDSGVLKIIFEDGSELKTIEDNAFCNSYYLEEITIPSGVVYIGKNAFDGCLFLKQIIVEQENRKYSSDQNGALYDKNKSELIKYPPSSENMSFCIPSTVEIIRTCCFESCYYLKNLVIMCGDNYLEFEENVFGENCAIENIFFENDSYYWNEKITIGDDNELLEEARIIFRAAPQSFDENYAYYFDEYNREYTIFCCNSDIEGKVIIPESYNGFPVTVIGNRCFSRFLKITEVVIPESVKIIEDYSFYNCEKLERVWLPSSLSEIGLFAFKFCRELKTINIEENSSLQNIYAGAFGYCSKLQEIDIPGNVKHVTGQAFEGCDSLLRINVSPYNQFYLSDERGVLFNKDKTEIVKYPSGIAEKSYRVPSGIKVIGINAFSNSFLTNVYLNEELTTINNNAFSFCNEILEIEIRQGVKKSVLMHFRVVKTYLK